MNRLPPKWQSGDGAGCTPDTPSSEIPEPGSNKRWIKVRSLGEFVFCRRAGQLSVESDVADTGDEPLAPRLDYMPHYELREIRDELHRIHLLITKVVLWGTLFSLIWLAIFWHWYFRQAVLVVGVFVMIQLPVVVRLLRDYFSLCYRLFCAQIALITPLDLNNPVNQAVTWFGLIKAGYESIELRDELRDHDLKLAGKPFRILQHGSFRIPVIRLASNRPQLYPNHHVRLAAYGYLIETCEHARAPFGILLFGNSDQALAVPITPESKRTFQRALSELRKQLHAVAQQGQTVAAPTTPERCLNCPFARLRRYVPGQSESCFGGIVIPANTIRHYLLGPKMHCDCGDRFEWHPWR